MLVKFLIILITLNQILNQDFYNQRAESDYYYDEYSAPDPQTITQILNTITSNLTYRKESRPTGKFPNDTNVDKDGSLIIKMMLSYRQLISLDEKLQILTSSFYLLLNWGDPRLQWDPSDYENITEIVAPANNFWMPDIAIINAASPPSIIQTVPNLNALITNDGNMYVSIGVPTQQTRCKLNVLKYPFDTQTCSITIGSWGSNSREFNFNALNASLQYFSSNPTWSLISLMQRIQISRDRFDLINMEFTKKNISTIRAQDVQYTLSLKRNPLYIMINGILPCFVLNLVVLLCFFVPIVPQCALSITSILSFIMTQVRISSDIPVQSEYLPLLTLYFLLSVLYTLFSFIWFVIIERQKQVKRLPRVLIILAKMGKKILFWMYTSEPKEKKDKSDPSEYIPMQNNIDLQPKSDLDIKKEKEKKAKQDQAEFPSNIDALNNLMFIFFFFLIFICNTTIWVIIGS